MPLYSPQRAELYNLEHTGHLGGLHEGKSFRRMEVLFSEFLCPVFSVRSDPSGIRSWSLGEREGLEPGN